MKEDAFDKEASASLKSADELGKLDTIFKYCIPNNYYLLPTKIDNKKSFKLIKQEEVY